MVYPRIEKLRDRIIWGVQYFLCVMRVRGIICHVKLLLKTPKTSKISQISLRIRGGSSQRLAWLSLA